MPAVPIARLRTDLACLYVPPYGAVATWRKMRQVLGEFERFAGVKKTSDLTAPAVAKWIDKAPARSPATTRTLLSSLRRACTYAKQQGWLRCSPFDVRRLRDWVRDLEVGADDEPAPRHHPFDDLKRVMSHLQTESRGSWEAHRLYALAVAAVGTGARALEIQTAKVADFDLSTGFFHVRANPRNRLKTRRSKRSVPMPPDVRSVLAEWLPLAGSEWAFPGARRKTPWLGGSPGRKPLCRLKAAGEACGVRGLTFLSLRHSYITHSQAWGIPDLLTQQFAGHTQRATTQGYRGFDPSNAVAAVATISFGLARPKPTEGERDGKAQAVGA